VATQFEDGGEVGRSDGCKISEEREPEEEQMEGKGSGLLGVARGEEMEPGEA
jgi:hypothetical protein